MATTAFQSGVATAREFGVGYGLTHGEAESINVSHTVAVLPGDETVVHIEVVVSNKGTVGRNLTFAEFWGSGMVHQLTGHGWGGWSSAPLNSTTASLLDRRAFVASHYHSTFSRDTIGGFQVASQSREFLQLTASEQQLLRDTSEIPCKGNSKASLWDAKPPEVFLARVGEARVCFGNNAREWYGGGGMGSPRTLRVAEWHEQVAEGETALISSENFTLASNQSVTLRYIVGYNSNIANNSLEQILKRAASAFGADTDDLASTARKEWAPKLVHSSVSSAPWVEQELLWHSYMLASAVSFDSYFQTHIVDQGTAYRYSAGFQGAIRDPLQHALALIHNRPDLMRDVLRYSLREAMPEVVSPPGSATDPVMFPDSVIGSGVVRPDTPRPDDFEVSIACPDKT